MIEGGAEEFGLFGVVGSLEVDIWRAVEEPTDVPMDEIVLRLGEPVERHDGEDHGPDEAGRRQLDPEISTRGGHWFGYRLSVPGTLGRGAEATDSR